MVFSPLPPTWAPHFPLLLSPDLACGREQSPAAPRAAGRGGGWARRAGPQGTVTVTSGTSRLAVFLSPSAPGQLLPEAPASRPPGLAVFTEGLHLLGRTASFPLGQEPLRIPRPPTPHALFKNVNRFIEMELVNCKVHSFQVCRAMVFSMFTESFDHHHNLNLGRFLTPNQKPALMSSPTPFHPPPRLCSLRRSLVYRRLRRGVHSGHFTQTGSCRTWSFVTGPFHLA